MTEISENIHHALPTGSIVKGGKFSYKIVKVLKQNSFSISYLVELLAADGSESNIRLTMKEFFVNDFNGRDGEKVTASNDSSVFDSYRKKFTLEAMRRSSLKHKNIADVTDILEANETAYFLMNYLGGESLEQLLATSGPLSERLTLEISAMLCSALACLHDNRMRHLDVNPANIVMISGRVPVLMDFGLSKCLTPEGEPEASTRIASGTPGYAPLEQLTYKPKTGLPKAIDVYGLGATMFTMLTGERPPVASDILNLGFPKDVLKKHGVSDETIAIIEKAMAPALNVRFPSMHAIFNAVREVLIQKFDVTISETIVDNSPTAAPVADETNSENIAEEKSIVEKTKNETTAEVAEPEIAESTVADQTVAETAAEESSVSDEPSASDEIAEIEEEDDRKQYPVYVYILAAVGIIILGLILYFSIISGHNKSEKTEQEAPAATTAIVKDSAKTDSVVTDSAEITPLQPEMTEEPATANPRQGIYGKGMKKGFEKGRRGNERRGKGERKTAEEGEVNTSANAATQSPAPATKTTPAPKPAAPAKAAESNPTE